MKTPRPVVEFTAHGAIQRQGVRGHLHHDSVKACVHHTRQETLELDRLGRGVQRAQPFGTDVVGDCSDQADSPTGPFENRLNEIADCRLSVGTGDPDHLEA